MILDVNDFPDGHAWTADLCIVGSGAAGIAMALEFIRTGTRVLLLEAGGESPRAEDQALYEGTLENDLHSPPDRYRQRRFGGTTTIWGGRCMPFDPIDFEQRDYVPHSGWPIGFDDVEPFYPKANRICEAGDYAYTIATAFDHPRKPMIEGFESAHFTTDTLERFSLPTDFGARYGHKLRAAPNLEVLLNASVTELHLDPSGRSIDPAR